MITLRSRLFLILTAAFFMIFGMAFLLFPVEAAGRMDSRLILRARNRIQLPAEDRGTLMNWMHAVGENFRVALAERELQQLAAQEFKS